MDEHPHAVDEEYIDAMLLESNIQFVKQGKKTMVAHCQLPNGFEVVVSRACVDPSDFDYTTGKDLCIEALKTKVWELEGYAAHVRHALT